MIETWISIKDHGGKYEISSLGRVKSNCQKNFPHRILKFHFDKDGYRNVCLVKNRTKKKRHGIHILVASHFIGDIPSGAHVCHKDNNILNNAADNLYIGDHKSNVLDRYKSGRTKLSAEQIKQIRTLASRGIFHREIGNIYSVHQSYVSRIVNRTRAPYIE